MNAKRTEVTRFLDHNLPPQVRTVLEKISTGDRAGLENEVLSDLANFFRRHYSGGDFLALRRYKTGVNAILCEGASYCARVARSWLRPRSTSNEAHDH